MYLRTEGVILKRRNFGEADRILTIYTKDSGKITALAKGVRRPKSKKAGHLEIGSWCKIFTVRGKNMDLLTEVELKHAFGIKDFTEERANKIYHFLELVDALTAEHQKNPGVFNLLISFLKKINNENNFDLVSSVFKIKLLSNLGFFAASALSDSQAKWVIQILEEEDFETAKSQIRLSEQGYLKLLSFLDSMVESLTERKLTTVRFLNGQ